MMNVFNEAPRGIQVAPHDPRVIAAGYRVSVREVNLSGVRDKDSLMLAFLRGLGLSENFGRNWDALYDVLTDPDTRSARLALVLCDYEQFRRRHRHLGAQLERVLLDAQRDAAAQGRSLWLLAEEPDTDPRHW